MKTANELASGQFVEKLAVKGFIPPSYGLGMLADYRAELKIAADRATYLHSTEMPTIYTHSLIDSLAYSLARVDLLVNRGTGTERHRETWALTMGLIGCMMRDTFKADEIFFLTADFDEETQFDQFKVQEVQTFILDGFGLNYTIIDADKEQAIDDITRVIEPYFA